MKIYIPKYRKDSFFSPIRSQYDVLKVYAYIIELLLYKPEIELLQKSSNLFMQIVKKKKSRVFFFSERKIFSIFFPFYIEGDGTVKLDDITIDTLALASINEFISELNDSSAVVNLEDFMSFFCIVDDLVNKHEKIFSILHALLMEESGYIRYDFDEGHVNGAIHPLHHFDVGFSNTTTYKIGLHHPCDIDFFMEFLAPDNETPCKYIERIKK